MAAVTAETREKVRALVREVLKNADGGESVKPPQQPAMTEHIVVNSLREKSAREFDRDESSKTLLTEDDLRGLEPGSRVRVSVNVKFTPLANDIVAERQLVLIRKTNREEEIKVRTVAIGCDHGGFQTKEDLKAYLSGLKLTVRDLGTNSTDAVDYPDYAHAVASAVGNNQVDIGIVIDGAGIGSAMTANKVPGVRAAACYSTALARNSREHNGANVLTLGAGQNSPEQIREIVNAFITTEIGEERHKKRVAKISEVERKYSK